MTTLSELKALQLSARKRKKAIHAKVLTTLLGDLETMSKAHGREVTDGDINAMVKKFLKGVNEFLAMKISDETRAELETEKDLLESLVPKPATKKELKDAIKHYLETATNPNVGSVMSYLRGRFQGNYDGKEASQLAAEALQPPKSKK